MFTNGVFWDFDCKHSVPIYSDAEWPSQWVIKQSDPFDKRQAVVRYL